MFPLIHKVWQILSFSERRRAVVLLLLMVAGMGFEMLGVGLMLPVLALLANPESLPSAFGGSRLMIALRNFLGHDMIFRAMLLLVLAYLVKSIFLSYLAWRQARFSYSVQAQVSYRLFSVYLRQPYGFHLQRNSAQLIRNAVTETQLYALNVISPGLSIIAEGLVFLGLCTLLIYLEPLGTTTVIGALGLVGGGFYASVRNPIVRWGGARQFHEGQRIQQLQQGLGGIKDVILLNREKDFLNQYKRHSVESARVASFHSIATIIPRLWLELLAVLGMALLVLVMMMQGKNLSSILPILGVFAAAALRVLPSVNRFLIALNSLRYGSPIVETLYSELQLNTLNEDGVVADSMVVPFHHSLNIVNLSYSYPNTHQPVLSDISLQINYGEMVGFIGSSGAGKSTLVDVLLGLLEPRNGSVLMDGSDIRTNLSAWQKQIGYVPQDIFLTDDSLRRNIAFGIADEEIDDLAVWRAIRAAQIEGFINDLPDGFNTMVGERGVRISGGQRQRIGIARALYHDPPVLVLDEATSALDTATEAGVMEAVQALHGRKTVIIVAHRLTTVAHCDRLYRLEAGRIVEKGTPSTILERDSTFLESTSI